MQRLTSERLFIELLTRYDGTSQSATLDIVFVLSSSGSGSYKDLVLESLRIGTALDQQVIAMCSYTYVSIIQHSFEIVQVTLFLFVLFLKTPSNSRLISFRLMDFCFRSSFIISNVAYPAEAASHVSSRTTDPREETSHRRKTALRQCKKISQQRWVSTQYRGHTNSSLLLRENSSGPTAEQQSEVSHRQLFSLKMTCDNDVNSSEQQPNTNYPIRNGGSFSDEFQRSQGQLPAGPSPTMMRPPMDQRKVNERDRCWASY